MASSPEPHPRIRALNSAAESRAGEYVLYWMVAQRRAHSNFALDRAVRRAETLGKPLVVLEALRCGYRWASDRLHAFVIEGMRDNARDFQARGVRYLHYVERESGAGRGLLEALAARAALVVTDDWPCFFVPRMQQAAAARIGCRVEAVDSNGLLPLSKSPAAFPTAYAFRRFLQRELRPFLDEFPAPDRLERAQLPREAALPREIESRWSFALPELASLPIDHSVPPTLERGGSTAARHALARFVAERLPRYAEQRSEPESDAASGLSPWLHFGQLSAHEVFRAVAAREGWTSAALGSSAAGKKEGWWGMGATSESFLDELVTWRELGFHLHRHVPDCERYETLPAWARATLDLHTSDAREHVYTLEQFAQASTHDPLWNAAQRQLVREGRIHNYLRMLWGKKVLEWTASPREALAVLFELNNRYALDGRDPNSTSGITWTLGRFDRPWAPQRAVFGSIRWMSSANTARKLDVKPYLARWRA
ncbi:MAG: deoxyribodipyrimidine photolyase [Planctomycetes bacterium]|nr:deoxyribodipyrimidine photolyase [Planctomycetota bacterium]